MAQKFRFPVHPNWTAEETLAFAREHRGKTSYIVEGTDGEWAEFDPERTAREAEEERAEERKPKPVRLTWKVLSSMDQWWVELAWVWIHCQDPERTPIIWANFRLSDEYAFAERDLHRAILDNRIAAYGVPQAETRGSDVGSGFNQVRIEHRLWERLRCYCQGSFAVAHAGDPKRPEYQNVMISRMDLLEVWPPAKRPPAVYEEVLNAFDEIVKADPNIMSNKPVKKDAKEMVKNHLGKSLSDQVWQDSYKDCPFKRSPGEKANQLTVGAKSPGTV